MNEQQHVTAKQAASLFNVSLATVRRWLVTGKLPSVKIGRLRRIPIDGLKNLAKPTAY